MSKRPAAPASEGPLAGLRVIELGSLIAGPLVGRMLADFGAEVIKVEAPDRPDPMREWGRARYADHGLWWPVQARGKRLVTLNLRSEAGQRILRRLAGRSDVVVENFRPGTLERWGIGPDALHAVNPSLVIVRISGYGQTGPYARRPGFGLAGEAMGGLRYLNGYPEDRVPPRFGITLGDSLASLFAIQGLLMALYHRSTRGGAGQVVDASILESCFAMLDSSVPEYGKLGVVRGPTGSRMGATAPSNVFECRDHRMVAIGANSDVLFGRLCEVMGRPELRTDERYSSHWKRAENVESLEAIIAEWASRTDSAVVEEALNDAGVVCAPIYSVADIFQDAHFRFREMLVEGRSPELGTIVMPGIVPKLSTTPGRAGAPASFDQGQDNEIVYRGVLEMSAAEIAALREEGVM